MDEVTKASYGRAVTGTAMMARSANEEKKKMSQSPLRIRSVQVERVKELGSDIVTSHEVPMAIKAKHSQAMANDLFPFLHAFTPLITFWSNL